MDRPERRATRHVANLAVSRAGTGSRPNARSHSPMKCTACRVAWEAGYPIGTEHACASAVRMRGASGGANGQEADAWFDQALVLTAEIHSASSRFRDRISTPRPPPEPIANPHEPLECAALRILAEGAEIRAGQALRAIGLRHSPFGSTAFFVVAHPGCPHPLPRIRLPSVTLTCRTHSVSSGFDAGLSTTEIA